VAVSEKIFFLVSYLSVRSFSLLVAWHSFRFTVRHSSCNPMAAVEV